MAIEIVMPKLGWTMEEGILDAWMKQDGDEVQAGDVIFVVESDKALQEIEAFDSGILRILPDAPPIGSTIKIGALLAYLVQPGETAPFEKPSIAPTQEQTHAPTDDGVRTEPVQRAKPVRKSARVAISPRARRVAMELGVDWSGLSGSGVSGRIVERDVRAAYASVQEAAAAVKITPVARRIAEDVGLSLEALAERFPERRITRVDVEAAADEVARPRGLREPLTRVRRLTRDRMLESARTTAPVTMTSEVDATELRRLRQAMQAEGKDVLPSYSDMLAKLTASALTEHPALNATLDGDDLLLHEAVNIGMAVDSERGLVVPVIHGADRLSLLELAALSAELVSRAREGRLSADALQGGTFTISNLGMFDIDAFTPIINLPQCAILGVGRIAARQVVLDAESERVAIRHMMTLSLTFDHRLVDGGPAARFMQRVKQYVETPYLWLVS